jgi:hypothetical protein
MEMFLFCSGQVTTKELLVTTLEKCCSCILFLFLLWAGYHGGIIGHNTRKVLSLFFVLVLVLVLGKSQVIALRGSYSNDCRRKQIKWSLV